jgi:Fe-S-cluster-containing dehydrogenase component
MEFVDQGGSGMKTLLIDPKRCIQCCNCQNACKDEHVDNEWKPLAAKQGSGQFWIQIRERQAASGSRMRLERVPVPCQLCEKPACLAACPNHAIYQREDGVTIIDPTVCVGCGACSEACGYNVIYWNEELKISQKCTLCTHLLDNGWDAPRCVTACPVDALNFVDSDELTARNLYAPLERLHPEYGTNPQVAYVNLPKPFIAGAVYSPNEDRCLEGVELTLIGSSNGLDYRGQSDFLGEFRLSPVEPGIYDLMLAKAGYAMKTLSRLDVRDSLNVEDIRLYPQLGIHSLSSER